MDSNNTEEPLIDKEEPNDKERESKSNIDLVPHFTHRSGQLTH